MSTPRPSSTAREMFDELQRLIDAIDRRVPQLERLSEPAIARDAAELRERAVTLMRALSGAFAGAPRERGSDAHAFEVP